MAKPDALLVSGPLTGLSLNHVWASYWVSLRSLESNKKEGKVKSWVAMVWIAEERGRRTF